MEFVQVQFKSQYSDEFRGRAYTYIADVPVAVGDIVKVPTSSGTSEAKVCRVGIPEDEARNGYYGEFKHITEPAVPGGFFDEFMTPTI